ncbi:hypothetical protein B566_EDAN012848 [Ephemera danica]|nr:hypothetical protein B566_EDAN012848 [Ephemera danica]
MTTYSWKPTITLKLVFSYTVLCCMIVVILVSTPVTVVRVEASVHRRIIALEMSEVPLAHSTRDVALLFEVLWQQFLVQTQTPRLVGKYHVMLHSCTNSEDNTAVAGITLSAEMALRPSAPWWVLSLLITVSTAQIQQGGPCPEVESTRDLNLTMFMDRWYETMQTYRADGNINECTQYIFKQVSNSNNFTFDSYARNPKTKMDIYSQGESMVVIDSKGYSVFEIIDNGLKISVHILDTDYTNYAVLWACIPAENSHYENAVVLTRERNPSLEVLYTALDLMAMRNITTSFLVSVEHRNCPSRWTTPQPSQGTSSIMSWSTTMGLTSSTISPQNTTIAVSPTNISMSSTSEAPAVTTKIHESTTIASSTAIISTTTVPSTTTISAILNFTEISTSTTGRVSSTEQSSENPMVNSTTVASTTAKAASTSTAKTTAGLSTWTPVPVPLNTTTHKGTTMNTTKATIIPTPPPSVRSAASKVMGQFLQILFCWLIIEFLISYKLTGSWV